MTPFNINDDVKVKLTPKGRAVVDAYYSNPPYYMTVLYPWRAQDADAEGYLTVQLWDLMHVLGPSIYMGSEPLIESNTLHLP
jgi:hypothetical protein